jgi:hypothetical protein
VTGLPGDPINVVREDLKCRGLLFAGSETSVYVSFNDGENWQPLKLNMPATSIRDLVIKDNDLVIGTHGRSFWILDDITSLRHLAKAGTINTTLYQTGMSYRVRWNMNSDTPLPQEEPAGQNPPDGAIIDYYLKDNASAPVSLEIFDEAGKLVRTYKSTDTAYEVPPVNIPLYWIRPQQILSAGAGAHRFTWDMHLQPLNEKPAYAIAAIFGQTAPEPTSPWVMPGRYSVKLAVNGKVYTQPLTIVMDPRVKTPPLELKKQFDLSNTCYQNISRINTLLNDINSLHKRVSGGAGPSFANANKSLTTLETSPPRSRLISFTQLKGTFRNMMNLLQQSDMPVTKQVSDAVSQANADLDKLNSQLDVIRKGIPRN